ncbi:MAG: metalloregulator ArsR/SmtB family transcription factor [Magnetococcales bacterium]|nr:metalloregulator ArsR/SmtB family transcription factor [Magnetococcales bacterium]
MRHAERWTELFKALSEPLRLRLLNLLRAGGELCVCDLVSILETTQSMVSRHLAYLRHCGWVSNRREGLWIHYRLESESDPMRAAILEVLARHAEEDPEMKSDLEKLRNRTGRC